MQGNKQRLMCKIIYVFQLFPFCLRSANTLHISAMCAKQGARAFDARAVCRACINAPVKTLNKLPLQRAAMPCTQSAEANHKEGARQSLTLMGLC